MAAGDPTWAGTRELQLQPAKWRFTADGVSLTLIWEGPLETCHAERPNNGDEVEGFTAYGVRVVTAEIEELGGDAGRLTVQLESTGTSGGGGDFSFEPIGDPVFELDWIEVLLPIERHPDCGFLRPERPAFDADGNEVTEGGKQRTWDDWADLTEEDYQAEGDQWALEEYKSLKEAGHDSFYAGQPVARRTRYYMRNPSGVGAGLYERQNPPVGTGAPTGYQWLYTKATVQREGRFRTVVEEWTGADSWNELLYGPA